MRVEPRALVFRGSVVAAGLLIDRATLGFSVARLRVLAAWRSGSRLYGTDAGWLLLWDAPHQVGHPSPGAPVVARDDVWVTVPLTDAEWGVVAPSPDDLVVAQAGVVRVIGPGGRRPIDPSSWIDLGGIPARRADRGAEVEPIGDAVEAPAPIRRADYGVPDQDAAARDAQAAIDGTEDDEGPAGFWAWMRGLLKSAWEPGEAVDVPAEWATLTGWIGELVDGLRRGEFDRDGLSGFLSKRHERYFEELLQLLDEGELDAGLRRAVPLPGPDGGSTASAPSWTAPPPRDALSPGIGGGKGGGRGLEADAEVFHELRKKYRAAATQLREEGRFEEAAFVLADLMGQPRDAVELLASHGAYDLAARLAEDRGLRPDHVVSLCWLAGAERRALDLARRHDVFSSAIHRVERISPVRGQAFRRAWADTLGRAGRFGAAVSALWGDRELRSDAVPWIERGVEAGGVVGARLLAYELSLGRADPARSLALLADRSASGTRSRRAFADALLGLDRTPVLRPVAVAAWRALQCDEALHGRSVPVDVLAGLLDLGGSAALVADLPPRPPAGHAAITPWTTTWQAADTGLSSPRDIVLLPDGSLLLAEGPAGVRLMAHDGTMLRRWGEPADHLVLSDEGTVALLISSRDRSGGVGLRRVARLDLISGRADYVLDGALAAWCPRFDGSSWLVASDRELLMLDVLEQGRRALWRGELPAGLAVVRMRRDAGKLWLQVGGDAGAEAWRLRLPGFEREARLPFGPAVLALAPGGAVQVTVGDGSCVVERSGGRPWRSLLPLPVDAWLEDWGAGDGVLLVSFGRLAGPGGVRVLDLETGQLLASVDGPVPLRFRGASDRWALLWDDSGRLVWLDGHRLVADLRLG